jgi:hypothetical protein
MQRAGAGRALGRRHAGGMAAPLLSDLRNWFVGHVIAAEGVREGVLADFGFAIAQNGYSRPS